MTTRVPLVSRVPKPGVGHRLLATGGPGAEPLRVVELFARPSAEAHVAEAGPAEAGLGLVGLLGRGRRLRRQLEHDHVVHHRRVAGQDVGAGEVGVLLQLGVEDEAPVVVGADTVGRRGRVGLLHRERDPPLAVAQWLGRHRGRRRGGQLVALVHGLVGGLVAGRVRRSLRRCGGPSRRAVVVLVCRTAGREDQRAPRRGAAARRLIPAARSSDARRARAGGCGTRSGRRPGRC